MVEKGNDYFTIGVVSWDDFSQKSSLDFFYLTDVQERDPCMYSNDSFIPQYWVHGFTKILKNLGGVDYFDGGCL